jgi:hypothetical protein
MLITYSMEQNPSWVANRVSAIQKIPPNFLMSTIFTYFNVNKLLYFVSVMD